MELQEELKQQAISLGLCKQWQDEWGNPDIAELCNKYIRGLDFCIKHDYPSLDYLERNFKGKVEKYGIYINDNATVLNQRNIIANGSCKLFVEAGVVCDVTIRHTSEIHIVATNNAFVYVSMHDNSRLFIDKKDAGCRICVSHFGGEIVTTELVDKVYEKYTISPFSSKRE